MILIFFFWKSLSGLRHRRERAEEGAKQSKAAGGREGRRARDTLFPCVCSDEDEIQHYSTYGMVCTGIAEASIFD